MFKHCFFYLSVFFISACGAPEKKCKEVYTNARSGLEICMQEGWRVGKAPFANFAIEKDSFLVEFIREIPSSDPPFVIKKIWTTQYNVLAAFNTPCSMVGDDHAIAIDGKEGWVGTAHLPKTDTRPEMYQTFVMVLLNEHQQYYISSRCPAKDQKENKKLVEELCAAIRFQK